VFRSSAGEVDHPSLRWASQRIKGLFQFAVVPEHAVCSANAGRSGRGGVHLSTPPSCRSHSTPVYRRGRAGRVRNLRHACPTLRSGRTRRVDLTEDERGTARTFHEFAVRDFLHRLRSSRAMRSFRIARLGRAGREPASVLEGFRPLRPRRPRRGKEEMMGTNQVGLETRRRRRVLRYTVVPILSLP